MADPIALHKPIDILEPRPWEVALTQLRALMKNVIVNHERIRERILELKERYYEGQMGDGATNWERWAIDNFAYSTRYLRQLSSPHPLTMDKWQAKRLRDEHRAQQLAVQIDRKRAQQAWDNWPWARQEAAARETDKAWCEWHKENKKAVDKRAAKRLYDKEKKRVERATQKSLNLIPVSRNAAVIDRMVEMYSALPKPDQRIFLMRIKVPRAPRKSK